jgi:predicted acetyltransferase
VPIGAVSSGEDVAMTHVDVVEAQLDHKMVIRHLLELYQHDFSELDGSDVDDHGLYGYRYLDHYWTEDDRRPFLFLVDGRWAGFALVRLGDPNDVAEFFVLRKHRRHGIGKAAARDLFRRFPGAWQVRQVATNLAATTFWRDTIPVPFDEHLTENGPVQRFVIGGAPDG